MSGPVKLSPGSLFAGDYKVIRPLRSGGQGALYVVEQISTSKHRALKLMLPELVAQPASRKRFELEARIAARIQSDHVVESIASGVDAASGTPWLVMELLEGQDLAAYTQKKRHLPPAEVLEIFSQLCHALGEAHAKGIVHRDLKPENIFLATARRRGVPFMVKVLDFGIARILAEVQTIAGATTTGLGTPMWMAPEQAQPGGPVGPSTDVWPLGLLAFRLLTGYLFWKTPYDAGGSVMMLMAEAFMHPMPAASARAEHYKCKDRLPPGFDDWFAKCVSRMMEFRYDDATEAFAALEPILAAVCEEVPAASRASSVGIIAPAPRSPSQSGSEGASDSPIAIPLVPTGPRVAAPASVASPSTDPGVSVSTATGIGPQVTGPGRATWGAMPELAEDVVQSAARSGPGEGRGTPPPTHTPSSPTADQAPPVQTSARFPGRSRGRTVILFATAIGVLVGAVIFVLQRGGGESAKAASPVTAVSVAPGVPPSREAPTEGSAATVASAAPAEPTPSAKPRASSSSDTSAGSGGPAVAGAGGKAPRLCKQAGAKCFSNDDCCDRACRKWTCRANAALQDPYQTDGK